MKYIVSGSTPGPPVVVVLPEPLVPVAPPSGGNCEYLSKMADPVPGGPASRVGRAPADPAAPPVSFEFDAPPPPVVDEKPVVTVVDALPVVTPEEPPVVAPVPDAAPAPDEVPDEPPVVNPGDQPVVVTPDDPVADTDDPPVVVLVDTDDPPVVVLADPDDPPVVVPVFSVQLTQAFPSVSDLPPQLANIAPRVSPIHARFSIMPLR